MRYYRNPIHAWVLYLSKMSPSSRSSLTAGLLVLFFLLHTLLQAQDTNPVASPTHSRVDSILKLDFSDDWAQLRKYQHENATLPATDTGARVVFLGSSIFEFWKERMPAYFEQHPHYIDRGISGQISGQLLIRFQQDVIALHPKAVVILAGSNDLGGGHGHVTNETILNNVRSMVELARVHHIKPVICLYLPIGRYPWRTELASVQLIRSLNEALGAYAKQNSIPVLDYFTPLSDGNGAQRPEWTIDGVHPNRAGYEVMAKVTDEVLNAL